MRSLLSSAARAAPDTPNMPTAARAITTARMKLPPVGGKHADHVPTRKAGCQYPILNARRKRKRGAAMLGPIRWVAWAVLRFLLSLRYKVKFVAAGAVLKRPGS